MHGTDRGTAGLSTVGSAYHNGGGGTVFLFYLFLGVCYSLAYRRFLMGRRTALRCFSYGALFFVFSIYVAGAPVVLLNKGVLALVLLILVRKCRFFPEGGVNKMSAKTA